MTTQKLSLEEIKKAFDPLRRARFSALIDYFEMKNEHALAGKLKIYGEPKIVFHHPDLQKDAEESFSFMGCEIRKHQHLPEGMIVFSWVSENDFLRGPLLFIPERNSSLDGIRKYLNLPTQGEPCANPSQLNNGKRK